MSLVKKCFIGILFKRTYVQNKVYFPLKHYTAIQKLRFSSRQTSQSNKSEIRNIHDSLIKDRSDEENFLKKEILNSQLRPPVVTIMGHVDHGKTTLLDSLSSFRSTENEFGGITQHLAGFNLELIKTIDYLNSDKLRSIRTPFKSITFIDTPGHAAFSNLRMRGASITDMVILIVAADDGVMPQTVESIKCAQKHNCPIIVAINKIDRPDVDLDLVRADLAAHNLVVEQLGGNIQCIEISALKKKNLDHLLEAVLLQAEFKEKNLMVDHGGRMEGIVLESRTQRGIGKIATSLITRGRFLNASKRGPLIAGLSYCRPKIFLDDRSNRIVEIEKSQFNNPGFLIEIAGWTELPKPGELIFELENESQANQIIKNRRKIIDEEKLMMDSEIQKFLRDQAKPRDSLSSKQKKFKKNYDSSLVLDDVALETDHSSGNKYTIRETNDERPCVKFLLKCDVEGSRESIINMMATIPRDDVKLDIVQSSVGPVTISDVENAKTFNSIVLLFNVQIDSECRKKLEDANIKIIQHNVVYHLAEDIKQYVNSLLPVQLVPERLGLAVVKQLFDMKVKKVRVFVIGCNCLQGNLIHAHSQKNSHELIEGNIYFRIFRRKDENDTTPLKEVTEKVLSREFYLHKENLLIKSLKHKKNPVSTIKENGECGMVLGEFINGNIDDYTDVRENDVIECYSLKETKKQLAWHVDKIENDI